MSSSFRLACVQVNAGTEIVPNVEIATTLVRRAAEQGADFISLPECVAVLEPDRDALFRKSAAEADHPALHAFRALARELGLWLHVGSLAVLSEDGRIANRTFLIGRTGEVTAKYDKIHMFDAIISSKEFYKESSIFTAGKKVKIGQTPWGKVGLSICYDMRFPELYRSQVAGGAKIISIPSAFTVTTGKAHWHTLLKARAIESGCYVFAPAQCGQNTPKRKTYGHSLIVSPYGKILKEKMSGTGIITCKINMDEVDNIRKNMPSYQSKLLKRTIS